MGYYITVTCSKMVIPKAKVNKALEAIKSIPDAWVSHDGKQTDLVEAFEGWLYEAVEEENGNITIECFNGEKLGDDEILWKAIAPFIKKGGEVKYRGEDGFQWKYVFDGKTYKELHRSSEWV